MPAARSRTGIVTSKTVKLTSPDRVLYPDDGITKGDLFAYYEQVGTTIVPHLRDRPFTMKRYPHGITEQAFFQKQAPKHLPSWIPTREFRTWPREGGSRLVDFALVNSTEAVLFMVQNNCIDMNAWYSRVDKPDKPDFVLFDLDPPEDGFELAIEVAQLIRELLEEVQLPGYVKTSGADGIHVVAPIVRRATFAADLCICGGRLAAARAAASRQGHDRMAEEEAGGRPRRPPAERPRQDDRIGLQRQAETRRARLHASALGGAHLRRSPARLHDADRAGADRAARRPLRIRTGGAAAPGGGGKKLERLGSDA